MRGERKALIHALETGFGIGDRLDRELPPRGGLAGVDDDAPDPLVDDRDVAGALRLAHAVQALERAARPHQVRALAAVAPGDAPVGLDAEQRVHRYIAEIRDGVVYGQPAFAGLQDDSLLDPPGGAAARAAAPPPPPPRHGHHPP